MIKVSGLTKRYGDTVAINNLSLDVRSGDSFALLGPNGAGKTTLIQILVGNLRPTIGSVQISGLDCDADRVLLMSQVGYVPDVPVFWDYLRGREIVEFVARMHGFTKRKATTACARLLTELGLAESANEYAGNYSLGMRKRLALACALVHDPKVLILDEVTSGLDPLITEVIETLIRDARSHGRTIFLATHALDTVERVCTRATFINHGEAIATGNISDLKAELESSTMHEVFLKLVTQKQPDG